jgi:nucleoid DNA-binding protein
MNKSDLIDVIAKRTSTSRAAARASLDAALDGIAGSLKKGESVSLTGFGTFEVDRSTPRRGRGAPAGQARAPGAARVPKFKPGKALRDAVR